MERIFIDSSAFLEYILPPENIEIENRLEELYYNAKRGRRDIQLITSHIALGEVLQVIHKTYGEEEEKIALHDFNLVFNGETYKISTPQPKEIRKNIKRLLEKDHHLKSKSNDCLILAQALGSNADRVISLDKNWSKKIEELGIKLETY